MLQKPPTHIPTIKEKMGLPKNRAPIPQPTTAEEYLVQENTKKYKPKKRFDENGSRHKTYYN